MVDSIPAAPVVVVPTAETTGAAPVPAAANPAPSRRAQQEYRQLLVQLQQARRGAAGEGATARELASGDTFRKVAERHAARGDWAQAIVVVKDGIESFKEVETAAKARVLAQNDSRLRPQPAPAQPDSVTRTRTDQAPPQQQASPPIPAPAPVSAAPAPTSAVPPASSLETDRLAIELALREYARAMSAGDLAAMQVVFPNMPSDMRNGYKALFGKKHTMDTNGWTYLDISVGGAIASADLGGTTVLRDDKRKAYSTTPFPRKAVLQKLDGRWRLTSLE
jgi:hypothetical protein